MSIKLLDNRRLTGPNLFWDMPGAVLALDIEQHVLSVNKVGEQMLGIKETAAVWPKASTRKRTGPPLNPVAGRWLSSEAD